MERDQVWALRCDIERRLRHLDTNGRQLNNDDRRIHGACDDTEFTEIHLLRRTLAVLEEL